MGIRTRINELINKHFDRNDLDANGAIKSFVTRDNRLVSYVYDLSDPFNNDRIITDTTEFYGYDFDLMVNDLESLFDDNDRFDEIVTDRDWSIID